MSLTNSAKKKDSILLFLSDYESIKDMPDKDFGRLMKGLFEFHLNGHELKDPELKYAFQLLNGKIIRANKAYQKTCEERSIAGKRGNMKRWGGSQKSQTVAKIADSDSENDNESDIIKIKSLFLFEKLNCPVQPEFERFWHYYEKNDWHDGKGILITNKIACAMNWKIEENNMAGRLDLGAAKAWKETYNILKDREKSELMVTDIYGFRLKNATLTILCTEQLYKFIELNIDVAGASIQKGFSCKTLEYKVVINNEKQ